LQPDLVLLEFGANDWWRDSRPYQAWAADLDAMLNKIKQAGAQALVLGIFGQWPDPLTGKLRAKTYGADERSEAFAALEEETAKRHQCPYLPNHQAWILNDRCCWTDRNHPNELGNRRIADLLEPILEKILGCIALPRLKRRMRSIRDFWDEAVEIAPQKLAAVCGEERLTYAEADLQAEALAAGLAKLCRNPNPRVAVCLPNCLEYFLLYWAVMKIGGIIVPISPWLKSDSLQAIFANVSPDLLDRQGKNEDRKALEAADAFPGLPVFFRDQKSGQQGFKHLLLWDCASPKPEIAGATPAIIMHTSGTTSAPKGAVMLHSDLIFNAMTTIKAQDFNKDDIHLLVNPMFHCTALYSSLPLAAWQKTSVVITNDTQPESLLELIEKERVSTFLTVPTVLQRISALPDLAKYKLDSLRVIGYAGSFMPVKIVRKLQELFPEVALHNFFGLTETISATHVLSGEAALDRPDSIGQLLPFVCAMIVNEQGEECAANEIGELLFARENVISTYWNKPKLLQESLVEYHGRIWFRTGDLACKDEERFFFIKGRKKDMIIVGGENVFAVEVESTLLAMPELREVAVKGVPASGVREALGELIKAYIVLEEGCQLSETDIRRHCHKHLPSFKIPHLIQFMKQLPRNPAGKINKNELPE
jgi:acyl-CoA synthetase (AMP-forming)/AMP-acid ligase II